MMKGLLANAKTKILIEPQWNVDEIEDVDILITAIILIEPQWNVDLLHYSLASKLSQF